MTEFDVKAQGWDDMPGRRERALAVAEAIRREVQFVEGMSALEYGCGTGLLSFALSPFPGPITLADSSPGMLDVLKGKIAESRVENMTPLLLDLSSDPLPDQRFDLIYTLMVLHHIPDTQDILNKFQALLNPGGTLCIADLDQEEGTFHSGDFHGHHGFDRHELTDRMVRAGFERIRFYTPFSVKKDSGIYPMFLAIGKKK